MSYRTWHDFDDFDEIGSKYSEAFLKEQGVRYGLDPTNPRYQRADTGSQENFDQDGHFVRDLQIAANNDYDYRRASEAAKLFAGNVDYEFADKKWSEMSDSEREGLKREEHMANKEAGVIPDPRFANVPSSINSLEDIFYANKFMRDTYEDEGLGDKDYKRGYGTSNQRAAVKDYWVDTDRANFLDNQIKTEEPESSTPLTDELAQKGAPLSKEVQAAQDNLQRTIDSIRDGTYVSSYRRKSSGTGTDDGNESYSSQMLDTQMKNATSGINIDKFTQQRDERSQKIQDDFTNKLYRDDEVRYSRTA